jgi:hypothetical protein
MFHDLGLTPKYRTDNQRFEVDGADIARHGQRWWNIRAPISPPNGCWFWAASCEAAPGVATTSAFPGLWCTEASAAAIGASPIAAADAARASGATYRSFIIIFLLI